MSRMGTTKLSPQTGWFVAGEITTAEAALAVNERDVATADALTSTGLIKIKPQGNPYAMLLRFRADGAADLDSVLDMYAAKGNDFYHRIASFTIVTGTQDTGVSTIHFIDSITPANEDALFDGEESNLADMIAHYYCRTLGFDRFLITCNDLDSTTVYVDCCYLYE